MLIKSFKGKGLSKLMKSKPIQDLVQPGVSVVIPSYLAENTLLQTLSSLRDQSISHSLFEVIVVVNGPAEETLVLLKEFAAENPTVNLTFVVNGVVGAGAARNVGLSLASREYVTFIDADDWVENSFLESGLNASAPNTIALLPILNWEDGVIDSANSLNQRIQSLAGYRRKLSDVPWALGFNACKIIPRNLLEGIWYEEQLKSGEDLVFFSELLNDSQLRLVAVSHKTNAYVRRVTASSISRQPESFDFNVRQRLECVRSLGNIGDQRSPKRPLIEAQMGFVKRYMKAHPEQMDELEQALADLGIVGFDWKTVFDADAEDLVFAYCFPPFSDTSAIVAAKIISSRRRRVDIISADLSNVRSQDDSLDYLAARWTNELSLLEVPASFSNWEAITQYAQLGSELASERQELRGKDYETVYSRAMWAGSHVAGALFKIQNPTVEWIAEFSDPLRFGVDGTPRPGELTENEAARTLLSLVESFDTGVAIKTLFDLIEVSTLALADQVIFTNDQQRSYMLADYDPVFRQNVLDKSIVRPHPTPPAKAYHQVKTGYRFDTSRVNVAYFGTFYKNRGLNDVLIALLNAGERIRARVRVHIFTNNVVEAREEVAKFGLTNLVRVEEYLPYLEFLNACTAVDVLLVNDVHTPEGAQNPFLPSKVADYIGSGTKIWGIVEKGSPLSQVELDYTSTVGHSPEALNVLARLIEDFNKQT